MVTASGPFRRCAWEVTLPEEVTFYTSLPEGITFYSTSQAFSLNTALCTIPAGVVPIGR